MLGRDADDRWPAPSYEYDDYGVCSESQATDLFTTVDLEFHPDSASKQRETVFSLASGQASLHDAIMRSCRVLGQKLGTHELVAYLLLTRQQWNPHRLYECWDRLRVTLLRSIDIADEEVLDDPSLRHPPEPGPGCAACWEPTPLGDLWCLPCGHACCTACWREHIASVTARGALEIPCVDADCHRKLPPTCVRTICGDELYENVLAYLMDRQVAVADSLTNCPNPPCSKPINLLAGFLCNVTKCSHCYHEFCLVCHESSHAPASCGEKQVWETSTDPDIMQQRLFSPNMKKCPSCRSVIEKNGGCNHMTCRTCQHEFCWMCMTNWKSHPQEYYHCPIYKVEDDQFLKKPDKISPKFITPYHDEFAKRSMRARALRENMNTEITGITRKIIEETRYEEASTTLVKRMLDQLYWANQALQWAQAHAFCVRFEQVKDLSEEAQVSTVNPPFTPHQRMFAFAIQQLDATVEDVEKRLSSLAAPSGRISLAQIVDSTRALSIYREALMRHCDAHFAEITQAGEPS
jgi:ariadne-1